MIPWEFYVHTGLTNNRRLKVRVGTSSRISSYCLVNFFTLFLKDPINQHKYVCTLKHVAKESEAFAKFISDSRRISTQEYLEPLVQRLQNTALQPDWSRAPSY